MDDGGFLTSIDRNINDLYRNGRGRVSPGHR
jgi:hypothetical protein